MTTVTVTFKIQYDDGSEKTEELDEPLVLPQGATGLCFGTVPMLGDGPAALGLNHDPVYTTHFVFSLFRPPSHDFDNHAA
jgi:hypothetical protein